MQNRYLSLAVVVKSTIIVRNFVNVDEVKKKEVMEKLDVLSSRAARMVCGIESNEWGLSRYEGIYDGWEGRSFVMHFAGTGYQLELCEGKNGRISKVSGKLAMIEPGAVKGGPLSEAQQAFMKSCYDFVLAENKI